MMLRDQITVETIVAKVLPEVAAEIFISVDPQVPIENIQALRTRVAGVVEAELERLNFRHVDNDATRPRMFIEPSLDDLARFVRGRSKGDLNMLNLLLDTVQHTEDREAS